VEPIRCFTCLAGPYPLCFNDRRCVATLWHDPFPAPSSRLLATSVSTSAWRIASQAWRDPQSRHALATGSRRWLVKHAVTLKAATRWVTRRPTGSHPQDAGTELLCLGGLCSSHSRRCFARLLDHRATVSSLLPATESRRRRV
jgi:hypothetical protein